MKKSPTIPRKKVSSLEAISGSALANTSIKVKESDAPMAAKMPFISPDSFLLADDNAILRRAIGS